MNGQKAVQLMDPCELRVWSAKNETKNERKTKNAKRLNQVDICQNGGVQVWITAGQHGSRGREEKGPVSCLMMGAKKEPGPGPVLGAVVHKFDAMCV